MEYGHKPVLLRECLEGLAVKPDGIYVDGTLGRAGHSLEIAKCLTTGRLIAIDRDKAALDAAPARLKEYAKIDRDVVVSGSNDRALIWNKANWAAKRSKVTPANIAEMMRRLKV